MKTQNCLTDSVMALPGPPIVRGGPSVGQQKLLTAFFAPKPKPVAAPDELVAAPDEPVAAPPEQIDLTTSPKVPAQLQKQKRKRTSQLPGAKPNPKAKHSSIRGIFQTVALMKRAAAAGQNGQLVKQPRQQRGWTDQHRG